MKAAFSQGAASRTVTFLENEFYRSHSSFFCNDIHNLGLKIIGKIFLKIMFLWCSVSTKMIQLSYLFDMLQILSISTCVVRFSFVRKLPGKKWSNGRGGRVVTAIFFGFKNVP